MAAYLELPLRWHDFSVCPGDLDACVQTCAVVRLSHVAAVHTTRAHGAVVGPLRPRVAILGPVERVVVDVEQRVLLLNAEPRVRVLALLHHLVAVVPVVRH